MSSRTDALARYSPWIAVGAALLYFVYQRLQIGRILPLISCCAALAVAGALVRWQDALQAPAGDGADVPRRALRAAALLLPVSIVIAVLSVLVSPDAITRGAVVTAMLPVLLGWSIFLFLPIARPAVHRADASPPVAHVAIVAALVAGAIATIAIRMRVGDHWTSIDEVVYSLQAHLFVQGDYRWHLDDGVQRFFALPLMATTPEGPYAQYPPGYPGILAPFVALGVPWASGAMLAAIAVVSTYMLGRRCASSFVGVAGATFLATHFLFVEYASRYLSHAATMAAITSAAWLLFTPATASRRKQIVECVLAGLFLGIAATIRPVTAIGLGLSLWLWLLSSRGWSATRATPLLLALGMAIPCAALLFYDSYTNGSAFRLGYVAAQGHLNDLGPGTRGLMLYDAQGQRVVAAEEYTLLDALHYEVRGVLWPLMRDLMPVFTIMPLIAAAYAYRLPIRPATIAAFLTLPLAYFLYFDNGERFYLELLPFAALGVALIVSRAWEFDAVAGRALLIFLLGAGVASSATRVAATERERVRRPSDGSVVMRQLLDSQRSSGPMLVFVRNPPLAEPLFVALSPLNFGPFPGRIVVARDLGRQNASLVCRMPGRSVVIAESATRDHGARLLPAQPGSVAGASCRAPAPSTLTRIRG